jgi:diguanylate cyclase (GGDEF)-like protein
MRAVFAAALRRRSAAFGQLLKTWSRKPASAAAQETLQTQLSEQLNIVKKQQEQLRIQHLQFDTALNNISQGVCFFDGAQRLLVCNRRYVEMYDLDPESVRPGMTLREIIELRYRAGSCPAMSPDQYHAWRDQIAIADTSTDTVVELLNGRIFEIHHRPMPDGGWVATHADITAQRQTEAKIVYMAHHDALTGLANRALLNSRLDEALGERRRGRSIALHLLDLDHFKEVNDTLGHPAGDVLLITVAERLKSIIRESDLAARMGGDEFAVLQCGASQPADAETLAARMVDVISAPYHLVGQDALVGASIGIALAKSEQPQDELIRNADLALYKAKAAGGCGWRFFENDLDWKPDSRRASG